MTENKLLIIAALNGANVQRTRVATVPIGPEELAAEARRVADVGARVVHIYAREDGGALSYRVERYRETIMAIRERTDVLISVSTELLGVGYDDRVSLIDARPDIVWLPMGTMTRAHYDPRGGIFEGDHPLLVRYADTVRLAERARQLGVTPWAVCQDMGHLTAREALIAQGALPAQVPTVLRLGVLGGLGASVHDLCRIAERLDGPWVAVHGGAARFGSHAAMTNTGLFGTGGLATGFGAAPGAPEREVSPWALTGAAIAMGGHVRVGFEDGVAMPNGDVADSNTPLVQVAATLAGGMGRELYGVDEARAHFCPAR